MSMSNRPIRELELSNCPIREPELSNCLIRELDLSSVLNMVPHLDVECKVESPDVEIPAVHLLHRLTTQTSA